MFTHIHADDKKNGWCPPTDKRGRIFVNVRALAKEPQDIAPSYDKTEHFLRFIDKYVSRAIGNYQIAKWTRANKDKTLMDKVTASDIAYSIIVYENMKEVWEEEILIKASDKTDEEKRNTVRQRKQKYHEGRGKRLKRYADGWTEDGRYYYRDLLWTFKDLKIHPVWTRLSEHWMTYQLKHYGKQNQNTTQDGNDVEDKSGVESEEEDWRIDLEDDNKSTGELDENIDELIVESQPKQSRI